MINAAIDLVYEEMPRFNRMLAEGLAYTQMKDTHLVIDTLMKSALRSDNEPNLPKDFNYITYKVLDPFEEYLRRIKNYRKSRKISKTKRQTVGYDMTLNDTYMVYFKFSAGGAEIVRPVSIPFVRRGGITHIRGVKYGISPVLKTRGISTTDKGFFIAFQSSMVQFEWCTHVFIINDKSEHVYMPYSTTLHHKASKSSTSFYPPLAVWLFGKMGPKEVFKRYLDTNIDFYSITDPALHDIDTDTYAICTGGPAIKNRRSNFAVVIQKDKLTPEAKIMIGTMFYVGNRHPDRLDISNVDNLITWQLLLGLAIMQDKCIPNQTLISDIQSHFANLEKMLDVSFRRELLTENILVEDIYELLFYIIRAFTKKDNVNRSELANLWGKFYTCIEYVTFDLRQGIYRAHWDLINLATNQATRKGGGVVNQTTIEYTLNKFINTTAMQGINNNHGEVNAFMATTDNMILALTSHCIDQTDANKSSGKKSIDLNSPANHMHASFCEVGCISNLPKSKPIGPYRINMCVKTDDRGRIIESDKYRDIMAELAIDINQKGIS